MCATMGGQALLELYSDVPASVSTPVKFKTTAFGSRETFAAKYRYGRGSTPLSVEQAVVVVVVVVVVMRVRVCVCARYIGARNTKNV